MPDTKVEGRSGAKVSGAWGLSAFRKPMHSF